MSPPPAKPSPQAGSHVGERCGERPVRGALWRLPARRSVRSGRSPAMKSVFVTVGTTSFDDLIATVCSPPALQVRRRTGPAPRGSRPGPARSASTGRLRAGSCSAPPRLPPPATDCRGCRGEGEPGALGGGGREAGPW